MSNFSRGIPPKAAPAAPARPAPTPARPNSTPPAWLVEARKLEGTREIPGSKHSPVIMGWIRALGAKVLGIQVNDDETPWCGTFVAHCFRVAGIKAPPIAVRAMAWSDWGLAVPVDQLTPGTVLVFHRPGGGHVGYYVGEDATHYHVLGGNQSNAVNVMRIKKDRCVARRWPVGIPRIGGPVRLSAGSAAESRNEA